MISTSHPNGAKGDNSPSGAMAEVLGQRSLLGFGVVLAWLVLFHLLVNIWLLCVFSSLLVVLGSWLASQAVLESNNVVRLERFITFEQVPLSVDDEHQLDEEIHKTVRKIIRDFVTSWYSTVSSECGFEKEVQKAMTSLAMELKLRARQIDRKELTQRVLDLFGSHLQDYIQTKELVEGQQTSPMECWSVESEGLWNAYSRVAVPHLAMTSDAVEVNYTRAVVDLLLYALVPSPHLETRTGRFVVGELITCNVLLPFIVKMSDPDWINSLLIQLCGSSGQPEEQSPPDSFTSSTSIAPLPARSEFGALQEATPQRSLQNNLRADTEMVNGTEIATPDSAGYDVIDSVEAGYPHNTTGEDPAGSFLRHYMGGRKLNPFYQENDTDPDSPFADYKQISADSLVAISQEEALCVRQKECITSAENNHSVDLEDVSPSLVEVSDPRVLVNSQPAEDTPSVRAGVGTLSISSLQDLGREGFSPSITTARELLLSVDHGALGNHSELTEVSSLPTSSPLPSFSFEPLSSPEGPVLIQNLRITGTITAKEHRGTGSHPYTLYTIKYETAVGCETPGSIQEGPEDVEVVLSACEQPVAYHMVNRRYSEFLNLQTRLEEKTELRKLIKGVKGPKKIFPDMPFGNMDSDKIEARKGLLETFLKQLCAISEIANSEEMQEFLALNTDARIAFVKKPFIVSRIDKIVVNAIVDTLKTAFPRSEPQSPTEENEGEVDGVKLSSDKKSKSRLKFSSKNIPFMNGSDIRPVQFSCEQTSAVFNRMSLRGLEDFLTEQENLASRTEPEREDTPAVRKHYVHSSFSGEHSREPGTISSASETALAEVVLNILCLLMKEQWSWLCTENMQKTIRLLFGTLINRWLDVSVANLMCARYWVVYLQVIQEAVWPGGSLPTAPQTERSQQQKDNTRQEALHCLMGLLPDLVSDMLGSDKYKLSWQTALESLQDPYINRHLVYCIIDLLLDFLVPEIPQEEFQRKLLQTLLKNPEKLPA